VRKAKGASSRTAAKDEADKENVDNGGKPSRSKRSMKSNAKSVDDRDDLDVFDPENDAQMHEPQSKAAKTSRKAGVQSAETDSKGLAEREKELSKLKVCACLTVKSGPPLFWPAVRADVGSLTLLLSLMPEMCRWSSSRRSCRSASCRTPERRTSS